MANISAYHRVGQALVKTGAERSAEAARIERAYRRRLTMERLAGKNLTQNPFKGLKLT